MPHRDGDTKTGVKGGHGLAVFGAVIGGLGSAGLLIGVLALIILGAGIGAYG